jgi:hypothetical protein
MTLTLEDDVRETDRSMVMYMDRREYDSISDHSSYDILVGTSKILALSARYLGLLILNKASSILLYVCTYILCHTDQLVQST